MSALRPTAGLTLAIALSALVTDRVQAQTGTVVGTVYDSIAGRALSDAAVFLWDTPYRGVSGEDGHFRIEDVPEGEYTILFFHTRLGEMGVSAGPRPVAVRPGQEVEIQLATPSMPTVINSRCLAEDRPEGTGAVAGQILDGQSDVSLGGSSVTLSWDVPGSRSPETIDLRAKSDGWYYSCAVPADVPILLAAEFIGRQGARREVTVPEDGFTEAPVNLFSYRPTRITVRLVDAISSEPVEGAEAWLRGTDFRALSNANGGFVFENVPAGAYMLMTDHLAYGMRMDTLDVPEGLRLMVEMKLDTRPIKIAPITVTVEAAPVRSVRARGGIVITSQQIDKVRQRARDASDILRSLHLPGILVKRGSNGTICVGYITGQVKMFQTGCVEMLIFINDVRATNPNIAARLSPDAIERMVIYKPVEAGNLFGLGAGNGVWMIYTRGN